MHFFLPRKLEVISIQTVGQGRDSESVGEPPERLDLEKSGLEHLENLVASSRGSLGGGGGGIPTMPTKGKLSALPKGLDFLKGLQSLKSPWADTLSRWTLTCDY